MIRRPAQAPSPEGRTTRERCLVFRRSAEADPQNLPAVVAPSWRIPGSREAR